MTSRRRAALALALAASSSGALVACNFIVDAGSYSVGNSSGDASSVDTGVIAVDSSVIDTGTVVDSGTPGDTGSPAADSGPAKEAGAVCGQGLPTTSSTFQQLVTTCALAASCDPNFDTTMGYCITNDYLHSVPSLSCLLTITDCNGYQQCRGTRQPTLTQCPTTSTPSYCNDAGIGINCGAGGGFVGTQDCNVLGGTCGVYTTDAGAGAACKVVSSCPGSDPSTGLCSSGNDLYACINGVGYGQSCGSSETCINDGVDTTGCYYNLPGCSYQGIDTYTCSGNTVQLCTEVNNNGVLYPYNCSTAGQTCAADSDGMGNAGCLAPGCTSDDYNNCTESCSGSMATVCVGGAPYTFDCAKIGTAGTFTGCTTIDDGTDPVYASCQ
jgi:hypothetical protein